MTRKVFSKQNTHFAESIIMNEVLGESSQSNSDQKHQPQTHHRVENEGDGTDFVDDYPELEDSHEYRGKSSTTTSAIGDNSQAINASDGSSVVIDASNLLPDDQKEPNYQTMTESDKDDEDLDFQDSVSASGSGATAVNAKNSTVLLKYKNVKYSAETVIINEFAPQKSDESSLLLFSEVNEKELLKVSIVFTEPDDYSNLLADVFSSGAEERIYIIQGPENSGKYTTSLKLGLDICDIKENAKRKIFSHVGRNITVHSLMNFLIELKQSEPSIYIISDAFEVGLGLSIGDFSTVIISMVNKYLSEHDSYLILTTSKTKEDVQTIRCPIIPSLIPTDSLHGCFLKHFVWYKSQNSPSPLSESLSDLVDKNIDNLKKDFKSPAQINYFFYQLSHNELHVIVRQSLVTTKQDFSDLGETQRSALFNQAIIRLAQQSRQYGVADQGASEVWFRNLHENMKLFALLSVILQGFNFTLIEEIYTKSVQKLRDDNIQSIEHHATFGRDVIFSSISARLDEKGFVVFDNQALIVEVKRQIDSRHLLLWPLVDIFVEYINQFKGREHWEHRRELGAALGRIGIYSHGKLDVVLDNLAKSDDSGVAAASGYALAEICNLDVKYHAYVLQTITRWIQSGEPDLMWAAGASIWRVHNSLMRFLKNQQPTSAFYRTTEETIQNNYKNLSDLAENVDSFSQEINQAVALKVLQIASDAINENPDLMLNLQQAQKMEAHLKIWVENNIGSVLHAVWQMLWTSPTEVVSLLCEWMNTEDSTDKAFSKLRFMGILSATEMFKRTTGMQKYELFENIPLTQLIQPLLASGNRMSIQKMMQSINNWMTNDELVHRLEEAILLIVNRLSESELNNLRDGIIETWLRIPAKSDRFAKFLLTRSYILQGVPLGLNEHADVRLIWDTTLHARKNGIDSQVRNLFVRLSSRQNILLHPMGSVKDISFADSYPSLDELQLMSDLPRLVYPVISSIEMSETDSIIIVANDEILDFEDLESDLIESRMLIVCLNCSSEKPPYNIPLESWTTKDNHRKIENFLTTVIGSNLMRVNLEVLWAEINAFSDVDENLDLISTSLDQWVVMLDSPSSIQFGKGNKKIDLACLLSYTLIWLAQKDIKICLRVLDSWLANLPDSDDQLIVLRHKVGIASGKLIINVLGSDNSLSTEKFSLVSGLLQKLIIQGNWEVHRVILTAFRIWFSNEMIYKAFCSSISSKDGTNRDKSLFDLLIEYAPRDYYREFIDVLEDWLQDKSANQSVRRAAHAIKNKILLRQDMLGIIYSDFEKTIYDSIQHRKLLPSLPENQKYCLIIFNSNKSNIEYASIAVETFHILAKDGGYYPILCRVGQKRPVAFGTQEISPDLLFNVEMYELAHLMGPLMENLNVQQFAFLIFFGTDEFYDKEDWYESWRKTFSFRYPVNIKDFPGWPPHIDKKSMSKNQHIASQIVKFCSDRV